MITIDIYGQKTIEKSKLEKLNLKQIVSNKNNKEKRDNETNVVRALYNENFVDSNNTNPENIALSYLKEKSAEFGLSESLENVKIKKISSTPGGKYVYFEQQVDNIPVYSTTSLIAMNKGDTITYVLNNFRKNNLNGLNLQTDITEEEAIKKATEYLHIEKTIDRSPKTEKVLFESIDKAY